MKPTNKQMRLSVLLLSISLTSCVIEDKGCDSGGSRPFGADDAQQEMIDRWGQPELLYVIMEDTEYVRGLGTRKTAPRRVEYWGYPTQMGEKLLFDDGYFVQSEEMASLGLSSPLPGIDPSQYQAELTPQQAMEKWGAPDRDESEKVLARDVRQMSWYLQPGAIPRQLTFMDGKLRGAVAGLLVYDSNATVLELGDLQ